MNSYKYKHLTNKRFKLSFELPPLFKHFYLAVTKLILFCIFQDSPNKFISSAVILQSFTKGLIPYDAFLEHY